MKLLNTYENKDEAEEALSRISGEKRLASERDGTVTIDLPPVLDTTVS